MHSRWQAAQRQRRLAGETAQAEDELTASCWFTANAPPGSAEETAILALANDRSMSSDGYVQTCDFSLAASTAILDFRQGDEPTDTSDDRTFDSLSTLDALPFTDQPFWSAALACAKAHYLPGFVSTDKGETLSAGLYHTCGVKPDGSVSCWSDNDKDKDYGRATPPGGSFNSVSGGFAHTCGVKADGSVSCWGSNIFGQTMTPSGLILK